MKYSAILPVAFSTLLTVSLAAPLQPRQPSSADAEKRADTFLLPKAAPSLDETIHQTLNFGGNDDPLLFKKDAEAKSEVEERSPSGFGSLGAIDDSLDDNLGGGGGEDDMLSTSGFLNTREEKSDVEKRSPSGFGSLGGSSNSLSSNLGGGSGSSDMMSTSGFLSTRKEESNVEKRSPSGFGSLGGGSSSLSSNLGGGSSDMMNTSGYLSLFRRAEEAVEGAAAKVARAFHA